MKKTTNLTDLYSIAERDGITVCEYPLPDNVSVSVQIAGECYIGLDRSRIMTSAQEIVHLAHELGHCKTGSFYSPYSPLEYRSRHEYRANRWAIEHICPPGRFRAAYRYGCREIWEFAEYLGVTDDFAEKVMVYYKDKRKG